MLTQTSPKAQLPNEAYTVGWICAIKTELVAARAFLDEEHEQPEFSTQHDNNIYALGRMGKHNVVIAVLPDGEYGTAAAAGVARDLRRSFPSVRFGLMVGIGGAAPSSRHDIRLGDLVVSSPGGGYGGVIQYDFGKTIQNQTFQITRVLDQPPTLLRVAVNALKAEYELNGHEIKSKIAEVLLQRKKMQKTYSPPDAATDILFHAETLHLEDGNDADCAVVCRGNGLPITRPRREEDEDDPEIHYGLIASANQLMKDAVVRDKLAKEKGVLCFEMEAAGLMNHFPCLVIRGICDYSDTHKNKVWQPYAAMTAAAYAKDLLGQINPARLEAEAKLGELLSDIKADVHETVHGVKQLASQRQQDRMREWLSPPDPSTNLNTAMGLRQPGSGEWFLNSVEYSTWKSKPKAFLWLNGKTGCGKSVLSSTIILDQQQKLASSQDREVFYYFFDFNNQAKCTTEGLIRSLVFQGYCKIPDAQGILDSLHSSCHEGLAQPTLDLLSQSLREMLDQRKLVYILIDALDECGDRKGDQPHGLLRCLQDLYNSSPNIHLLITSRPEQDIKSFIHDWVGKQATLSLQSSRIGPDLCRYIQARVKEHSGLKRWENKPEVQQEIEAALIAKADGMFRWVFCQLEALEKCPDLLTLRIALGSLPPDLDETYARIVRGLSSERLPKAIRLLQLLLWADQPLELGAAVDALVVNPDEETRFRPENRMPIPQEITLYCSSLLSLTSERKTPKSRLQHKRWERGGRKERRQTVYYLQFAHFSVKEWLRSKRLDSNFALRLNNIATRTTIARVCLSYLIELKSCQGKYSRDTPTTEEEDTMYLDEQARPFGEYATNFWRQHALFVESTTRHVRDLVLEFFSNKKAYRASYALWGWSDDPGRWEGTSSDLSFALLCASHEGFTLIAEQLIKQGVNVNEAGDKSKNALHLASAAGHETLVELLLQSGADPNIVCEDGWGQTALHLAAKRGHERIVRALLQHGSHITADGTTALEMAINGQHVETVRVLLDNGAQPSTNTFAEALIRNSTEIVQLLLQAGADVHGPCGGQRDALTLVLIQGPAESGHVLALLENGANIAREAGEFNTLYIAAANNRVAFVSLLLGRGVDVDETGGEYGTALQVCSVKRHVNMAHELLNHGADANVNGGKYGNVLYAAVRYRPNPERGDHGSIVRNDKCPDQEELVLLLIKHGADLYAPSEMYRSALHAALCEGTVGVVSILLEHIQSTDPNWRQAVEEQLLAFAAEAASSSTSVVAFLPPESRESILVASVREIGDTTTEIKLPDQEGMLDLNQRGNAHRAAITAAAIEAACHNLNHGVGILEVLSEKVGRDFAVTEAIFVAALLSAAERCNRRQSVYVHNARDMIAFLLDRCVDHISITPAVLTATAKLGIWNFLSQKLRQDITVTEDIFLAALRGVAAGEYEFSLSLFWEDEQGFAQKARDMFCGSSQDMMTYLVDKCEDHSQITGAVLKAAGNIGRQVQGVSRVLIVAHFWWRNKSTSDGNGR